MTSRPLCPTPSFHIEITKEQAGPPGQTALRRFSRPCLDFMGNLAMNCASFG